MPGGALVEAAFKTAALERLEIPLERHLAEVERVGRPRAGHLLDEHNPASGAAGLHVVGEQRFPFGVVGDVLDDGKIEDKVVVGRRHGVGAEVAFEIACALKAGVGYPCMADGVAADVVTVEPPAPAVDEGGQPARTAAAFGNVIERRAEQASEQQLQIGDIPGGPATIGLLFAR
ncbi:MAG: hypothetical protein WEB63_09675 [Cucumibacter sp.]